ncbi:MAG: DUF1059 domain-containing protein [Bdellovibrionota bacterium]
MKTFSCKDIGVDCNWTIEGNNEEEIIQKAAKHGKEYHNIKNFNDDLRNKVRAAICEKKAA